MAISQNGEESPLLVLMLRRWCGGRGVSLVVAAESAESPVGWLASYTWRASGEGGV